jgi:hypothetical protein
MSIAMHTANVAAEMYLAGESSKTYADRISTELRNGMRVASILSRAMVTSMGRAAAPVLLRVLPDGMRWVAAATRIPDRALLTRRGVAIPAVDPHLPDVI